MGAFLGLKAPHRSLQELRMTMGEEECTIQMDSVLRRGAPEHLLCHGPRHPSPRCHPLQRGRCDETQVCGLSDGQREARHRGHSGLHARAGAPGQGDPSPGEDHSLRLRFPFFAVSEYHHPFDTVQAPPHLRAERHAVLL